MGISGGALALGAGIGGLLGAGPTANNAPPQFQMPNMGTAASGALGTTQGLGQYNSYGQVLPQVGGITQGLVNNPYAPGYQSGANTAGAMGQAAGLNAFAGGSGLYGYGTQVMNTAMDPQAALYNRTLAQVTQQQNVQNANAGVATSPYGAGLTDMNIGNFNIDWQKQQLQNQIAGLGAAGTAYGQAYNLQTGGANTYGQGSALPYSTFGTIGNNQLGALSQYGQFGQNASNIPQQQVQDYMSYLGQGAQQQGVNNNTAALGFGENVSNLNALGTGLGAIGAGTGYGLQNYFGGGYNSYGGGSPLTGDAYGGSAAQPLPGLTAEDYG